MFVPDPQRRPRMGRPIRWIAGLFSLLMVVAGASPALAERSDDPQFEWKNGVLCETADIDGVTTAESGPSSRELLGAKTAVESEIEELEAEVSSSTALSTHLPFPYVRHAERNAEHDPRSTEASGRLAPRAPPSV